VVEEDPEFDSRDDKGSGVAEESGSDGDGKGKEVSKSGYEPKLCPLPSRGGTTLAFDVRSVSVESCGDELCPLAVFSCGTSLTVSIVTGFPLTVLAVVVLVGVRDLSLLISSQSVPNSFSFRALRRSDSDGFFLALWDRTSTTVWEAGGLDVDGEDA
jgi:hypothetical protein